MSGIFDCLDDLDELQRHMEADPALAENMQIMGFIKRVPFQLDHNGATISKWVWTQYGKREMLQRMEAGLKFRMDTGQEKVQ